MSHYYGVVLLGHDEYQCRRNVEETVSRILMPYNEIEHANGFWDWYKIGGRWCLCGSSECSHQYEDAPLYNVVTWENAKFAYPFLPGYIVVPDGPVLSKYDWNKDSNWVTRDNEWVLMVDKFMLKYGNPFVAIIDFHG